MASMTKVYVRRGETRGPWLIWAAFKVESEGLLYASELKRKNPTWVIALHRHRFIREDHDDTDRSA